MHNNIRRLVLRSLGGWRHIIVLEELKGLMEDILESKLLYHHRILTSVNNSIQSVRVIIIRHIRI